jgi:hypothetical protein
MYKKSLLFVCMFFFFLPLKAQKFTSSLDLEIGEAQNDIIGNSADQIFHLKNGNILTLSQYNTDGDLSFRLYDSKMNFISKYIFGEKAFYKKDKSEEVVRIEFFRQVKDRFLLFFSIKKGEELRLMSCDLDPETITFSGNYREVLKRNFKEDSERILFSYSTSGDRSKNLITLYEEQESGKETAYHYIFNPELRLIKKAKFTNLKRTHVYAYMGSTVSDQGAVLSASYEIEQPKGTKTRDSIYMPLTLQVLDFDDKTPKTKEVEIEAKQLFDIVLGFDTQNTEIVVGGLYIEPYKRTSKGVFLARYDIKSLNTKVEKLIKFSDDLKASMFSTYVWGEQVSFQQILKVVQEESGRFYFVLSTGDQGFSRGITVMKIEADGAPLWSKHILRAVYSNYEPENFSSLNVISFLKDDKLHLFINHSGDFEELSPDDKFRLVGVKKTDLVMYEFDDEGDFNFERLLNYKQVGNALLNSYSFKKGSIYFKAGGTTKKSRLIRVKIYED